MCTHTAKSAGRRAVLRSLTVLTVVATAVLGVPAPAAAQNAQTAVQAYGVPVSLERAREMVARARIEAQKNSWAMAIAIVDPGGHLVLLERMDQTQTLSIQIAIDKARAANGLKRSTKALEDAVGAGRHALLSLAGVVAVEGGLPIIVNGQVVGAIGVSGASSAQDGQVAAAGLVDR